MVDLDHYSRSWWVRSVSNFHMNLWAEISWQRSFHWFSYPRPPKTIDLVDLKSIVIKYFFLIFLSPRSRDFASDTPRGWWVSFPCHVSYPFIDSSVVPIESPASPSPSHPYPWEYRTAPAAWPFAFVFLNDRNLLSIRMHGKQIKPPVPLLHHADQIHEPIHSSWIHHRTTTAHPIMKNKDPGVSFRRKRHAWCILNNHHATETDIW